MSTARKRTVCRHCRLQHLKCDDQKPACRRCERAGVHCVRGYDIKFKHDSLSSIDQAIDGKANRVSRSLKKTQLRPNASKALTFVDERKALESGCNRLTDNDQNGEFDRERPARQSAFFVLSALPAVIDSPRSPARVERSIQDSVPQLHSRAQPEDMPHLTSTAYGARSHDINADVSHYDHYKGIDAESSSTPAALEQRTCTRGQSFPSPSQLLPHLYIERSAWPLADESEAMLFRYYCNHLARNFDLLDPLRHFRNIVPQRAATCPILLNAIFALSARHLSRVGEYDPLASNRYYHACLQRLIPLLDDSASEAILDENLLASHVILRHLEEIEVPLTGFSPSNNEPSHLLGSHIFITAQERAVDHGGLREAAFWIGLRQDIYVAFVNQHSFIPTLDHCNIDRSCEPGAPNHVWSRVMVALCAEVIRYCFADEDDSGTSGQTSTYASLARSVAQWNECKPESFTPIFYRPVLNEQVFPESWFSNDEIVVGLQHYHLAKILLTAQNPTIPRLGNRGIIALQKVDDEIRDHVRALCGICLSNTDTAPNFAYASMAVTMAGDRFTDLREQEALLGLLEACDKQHGWPTSRARETLKAAWGWALRI